MASDTAARCSLAHPGDGPCECSDPTTTAALPRVERVRQVIGDNTDVLSLLRHTVRCAYLSRRDCPTCRAILEATNGR